MMPRAWRYSNASTTHAVTKRVVWSSKYPLSLRIVHTSPPKHASSSMYTYFVSRKVRYNLQEVKGYKLVTQLTSVCARVFRNIPFYYFTILTANKNYFHLYLCPLVTEILLHQPNFIQHLCKVHCHLQVDTQNKQPDSNIIIHHFFQYNVLSSYKCCYNIIIIIIFI